MMIRLDGETSCIKYINWPKQISYGSLLILENISLRSSISSVCPQIQFQFNAPFDLINKLVIRNIKYNNKPVNMDEIYYYLPVESTNQQQKKKNHI